MDFVFGFVGIPAVIFDAVRSERVRICGSNGTFSAKPSKNLASPSSVRSQVEFILRDFADRLRNDHHNALDKTAFALIAIGHAFGEVADELAFPALLTARLDWELEGETPSEQRRSKNALVDQLALVCQRMHRALPQVGKVLREQDNRTPLLLPVKNFRSKALQPQLRQLQAAIVGGEEAATAISGATREMIRKHPPQNLGERPCFVDNRKVEFHAPGRARHGFARREPGHEDHCVLSGLRRLGAPYDHGFHYDCRRGERKKLTGQFDNCHGLRDRKSGDPHLNIAPNDFVRA